MTQTKFFIISSATIFILERVLQPLFSFPIFIFPVFIILFALSATGDILAYLPHVAIATLCFDFFSGLPFGWMTIAMLAVFLTIYLARNFLNIRGGSLIFTAVLYLIFTAEYFFLLSIKTPHIVISQAPTILAEAIVLLIFMKAIFIKADNRPSSNFASRGEGDALSRETTIRGRVSQ